MIPGHKFSLKADRRQVLQGGAAVAAGLILGFNWPDGHRMARAAAGAGGEFAPNAFVRIAPDNTVTIIAKHIEFGQGSFTGLATILAEELDADWAQVRVEAAPADVSRYANTLFGAQGTGGSTAIANSYRQLREAGAAARFMLVQAAAKEWGVTPEEITLAKGVLSHAASGKRATFGELAARAAGIKPPAAGTLKLKDPARFTLIGTRLPRKDTPEKITGTAIYTFDVKLPGMLTALVARPPRFGAKVKSFDAKAAKAVKGVVDVIAIPTGVAVLAEGFWAAKLARDALAVAWDETQAERRGTADILAEYRALLDTPGAVARKDGAADTALASAAKVIEAVYEYPYLAHAPMEPVNCVVQLGKDTCEIWSGCQFPSIDQNVAASVAGLRPEQVIIHTLYAGGSFGRRATPSGDFTFEAVSIAKAIGGRAPVRLLWTREDDIRGGLYRPLYVHRLRAGLDAAGNPIAWEHRIVGQSIIAGSPFEAALVKNGIDGTSVEGASNLPYAIPNMLVDLKTTKVGVPVLWWRAVGSTHTAFSCETMIDELAEAAGKDPVEFRRALLAKHPRHLAVMNLAAEKAGWGTPLPEGRARGIAVHESFNSFVAQVAEVRLTDDGRVKVERVVCAVDCGLPINPDVIAAQMEGGIGYGLGAILNNAITLREGLVEQSNFHDYQPFRIGEMPKVEVHIVPSAADPTGVGEPGVPPIGPAVANAVYRLTGKRIRSLPFSQHKLA
jgi:isoquinoline 1-oxidoreductase beta subunit